MRLIITSLLPRLCLFTLLCCCSYAGQSQTILTGQVADQSKITLPSAQIILLKGKQIKGYTLTDATGNFTIEVPDSLVATATLESRMFGYASQSIPVSGIRGPVKFALKEEAIDMKTVEVTADALPMSQREDTLMFNTASYTDGTEEKVEDMLKKIPGVDVDEDGQVSVHGQAIDRVLIDGDDTFGKNYRLATRNINAGFINRVDVISNFSEDQLTGDLNQKEELVLDLKLENSKKSILFGEVELAAGLPGGIDNDANLFLLSGKTKAILFAQNNTMGQDPSSGIDMSYQMEGNNGLIAQNRPDLLSTPTGLRPKSINSREYLQNEVYATAGSILLKPSKAIRSRTIYSLDNNLFRLNNQERINFFNQDIPFTVDHFKFYRESERKSWIDSENNFSFAKHSRIDLNFKGTISRRSMSADLTSTSANRSSNLLTSLDGTPIRYNARLRYTRRINANLAVRLVYSNDYQDNDQVANHVSDRFTPLYPEAISGIRQDAGENTIIHNPYVNILYSHKKWFFDTKAGYRNTSGGVTARGFSLDGSQIIQRDESATNLNYQFAETYLDQDISRTFGKIKFSGGLNLAAMNLAYANNSLDSKERFKDFVLQPYSTFEYQISSRSMLTFNAAHRRELPAPNQLIAVPFLSDHQTLMTGLDTLYLQRSNTVGLRYRYTNSFRQLSYFINAQRTSIPNGLQRGLGVSAFFTTQTLTAGFPSNSIQFQVGANKFVRWLNGSVDLKTQILQFNNRLEVDNSLQLNRYQVVDTRFRYLSSLREWLKLSVNTGYKRSENINKNSSETVPTLDHAWHYGAGLTATIAKKTLVNLNMDGFTWKQNQEQTTTILTGFSIRHTFPSGFSVKMEGTNLLNQRTFLQNYVNSFQVSQRSFQLRPRTILCGLTWSF